MRKYPLFPLRLSSVRHAGVFRHGLAPSFLGTLFLALPLARGDEPDFSRVLEQSQSDNTEIRHEAMRQLVTSGDQFIDHDGKRMLWDPLTDQLTVLPETAGAVLPEGFTISRSTLSPDGWFGVLVPDADHYRERNGNRLVDAAAAVAPAEPEFRIPEISQRPEALPRVAAEKQAAVFSLEWAMSGGNGIMHKGFFLSRDGVALCPLLWLCRDSLPGFRAGDGTVLDRPKVLATFPDHSLALLKFEYQPKAWLEIAAKRPDVGQWVAHVSTLREPPSPVGPVLSYRARFDWDRYPAVATKMGYAAGSSPSLQRMITTGTPLIDSEGKAVAVHDSSTPLALQTLYSATPLDDLGARIEESLKNPGDLPLPIDARHHSFEAAVLSPEWGLINRPGGGEKAGTGLEQTRKLMEQHPACRVLIAKEWELMSKLNAGTMKAEEFLAATRRGAPPENAGDPEMAYYQYRLGVALHEPPGRKEEAKSAYRKAFSMEPELLCFAGVTLADLLMMQGETKEGGGLLRKVATLTPERIDYIELLRAAVEDKGDWKTADELGRWIYQLEEYYRSR